MSITNITYLDKIIPNNMFCFTNSDKARLYFNDNLELKLFLNNLDHDSVYVVTFELILSWLAYDENLPIIILSKPILITKNSNPEVISKFIKNRIYDACNLYYLDESLFEFKSDNMCNIEDAPGVLIKYKEINLF